MTEPVAKLADIKYVYVRSWGDGSECSRSSASICCDTNRERSMTSLKRCGSRSRGQNGFPWTDAPKLLAYRGEKQMARKALEYLKEHAEL